MAEHWLWLDSSVAFGVKRVKALGKAAEHKSVRIVVHPQIHLEQCRQVRASCRETGREFSPELITSFLQQNSVEVIDGPFTRELAEAWAEHIDRAYPSDDAWRTAKWAAARGLPAAAAASAAEAPMTTDWLLTVEVLRRLGLGEEHYVAVNDAGEEWRVLRELNPPRAFSFDACLAWLSALP